MCDTSAVSLVDDAGRSQRIGIALCLLALFLIAVQDGLTEVLIRDYPVAQIVMFRFWVFAGFAAVFASSRGGLGAAVRSRQPVLQIFRSLVFVGEIALIGFAIFGEVPDLWTIGGAMLIVVGGGYVVWRERRLGEKQWTAVPD